MYSLFTEELFLNSIDEEFNFAIIKGAVKYLKTNLSRIDYKVESNVIFLMG